MIDRLKPYPAYKESGVPWLGKLPEHWEAASVKRHYNLQLGKMLQNQASDSNDREVSYLKAQHVQWFAVRTSGAPRMWASPREMEQFGISAGDLLVCEGGEGGRCGIVKEISTPHIIQNALHRVRPLDGCGTGFLQYVMRAIASTGWFDAINNKATIAHFTRERFGALAIPVPPVPEQNAIVRYLNHASRRTRRYIRVKQRLIALLEEQKQAIIHRAVTNGLDPKIRLKPSGVEWLSDVPEHWEVRPAKHYFREVDERSTNGTEELLSVSHISGVTPRSQKNITMFMAASYVGHKVCVAGDLVINTMWAWMAALGVARQTGLVSPSYAVYRPRTGSALLGDYANILLRTRPYVNEYICRSTGIRSSRLRLYPEEFLRIRLALPPLQEQAAILGWVASESKSAQDAIDAAQKEITLLREFRTRLIADVVTGKLDVREAAAKLPHDPASEPEEPIDDIADVDAEVDEAEATVEEEIEA